jgi:hypothetical protein
MSSLMAATATRVECSVSPAAHFELDQNDERIDRVLDALIADPRALGAGSVSYDGHWLSTVFQVELAAGDDLLERAVTEARAILAAALEVAGIDGQVAGVSVVEGSDSDLLP